jgi:TolA-binding protein
MRQNLLALAFFSFMLPIGAAQGQTTVQSQEGIALENQILQLQQQMQQLQSGGGGNGGSSLGGQSAPPPESSGAPSGAGSIVGSLLNQVNQLQSQVQQLSGEVDTLQNQVNTQHDATEKEIGDLKFQMSGGAGGAPGAPAPAPNGGPQNLTGGTLGTMPANQAPEKAPPEAPPPSQAVAGSPKDLLRAGQVAYARHEYATAEAAARQILSSANSSPEAYRAQYLLGLALSGEGKPQDAAIAYDNAYNRNRNGAYAPQSLLGLANSLAEIKQNEAACDTLSSLNSQFPTPPAGMQSRIDEVSHRAHCS